MALQWHPFQLRPDVPEGGVPLSALLPPQYLQAAEAHLEAATKAANLPLNRPPLVPNTHLAHEAAAFAAAHGQGDAFHRATLRAYFAEARDIGSRDVLGAIGGSVGLDARALEQSLQEGTYREAVDRDLAEVHRSGVSAVPTFVFAPGTALSGAQPYEIFQRAMAALGYAPRA